MEKTLLALWQTVPSGNIKQTQVADLLGLSSKQTTRLLRKWSDEGWFTFTSGRGRGNTSHLEWHKNVEDIYEQQLVKLIEEQTVEAASKYLLFDWSPELKQRLMHKFRSNFGYVQNSKSDNDKLIIPRKYPLLTLHPLYAADVHSVNMVAAVYSRLVSVNEQGDVSPELAHSWDLTSTSLRLYLRKEVHFHNGSFLTVEDVVECLGRLRTHASYVDLWKPITTIKTISPHILEISFPGGCSYCLQMLGMINASIYKETAVQPIGSGSFFVEENHELKTTLTAFGDYFKERPLLDTVEFIQVPEDFDFAYRTSANDKTEETFQVESDSGFGVVVLNAFRDSPINRQEVRDYVHYAIAKHRHKIGLFHPRAMANHQSCLIGQEQPYSLPAPKKPHLEQPLIIKAANYTNGATRWLKGALESEGIPVEIQWLSFRDKMMDTKEDQTADLFVHGEVFEMNQNFSFFYFLSNGYSPLATIMKSQPKFGNYMQQYATAPFENWTALNLKIERELIESSIMLPLYYEKRQIPFSVDLMNISISHFGYVDFSKLWVRPVKRD
ncbi:ABC transporter substrate-binding protein [Planococcus antarcticus DSM 14505]|uniref:ABC transporter substrate-binding protein n=1 Tax=Planococcus antarcticus DSM 14505 TaxID=1185653 RepID=A0A1C7DI53_9BACL|nr:ABC transporter substrate-binding protein [Planococcus antarcticus]ANU10961.1 ABC transporter substrate-binding protein [Planococcus antarcticus DSM 14505]EIM07119.1 ABC transporter substrate-binding protein [Planococcus antarcticus DSM 14505]